MILNKQVKEVSKVFAEKVNQKMVKIVERHRHDHHLYKPTIIKEFVIKEKLKVAVFILFEQINTDRGSGLSDEGWFGDQFRY